MVEWLLLALQTPKYVVDTKISYVELVVELAIVHRRHGVQSIAHRRCGLCLKADRGMSHVAAIQVREDTTDITG